MKIGEASERLGISISNIRFYEKKGLIDPVRDKESKYRDYTEADLDEIKQIIVLRKMGMSIETITDIQNGDITVAQALTKQLETLDEEEAKIYASKSLCQKAISDGNKSMEEMVSLFDYVADEEKQGVQFSPAEEFIDNLASALNYDNIVTTLPWGFMIYTNPVLNKIGKIIWSAYLVLVPLLVIISFIIAKPDSSNGMVKAGIMVVWLLMVCYQMFKNFKTKRD
ncbi:MerR family transcriptional regulator [Pseudobutyrivibrio xylanivorans]|uniref:DNA-binding transcriptional regulator, MerR family n=1 Tax=Pseudobutyrivibrio xylanivorans DSM 14809 TaxID=1123012 RepID=A0A1M6FX15_PSEXY|nr:MerR family transcriptional regulator [Pseudobutyrivibrio xylanivorans]SHJ02217.1 DNA-binding transcriptional regulator, MerR family [Pseudobutyrivibrio xylanivorans DSM 14809]